jgi:hypothetical protein
MNTHMDEPLNKPYHSVEPSEGRFAALLSTASCMRPVYDKILFEVEHCVVTPISRINSSTLAAGYTASSDNKLCSMAT